MGASFGPPDAPRMPEIAARARALRDELLALGETELTAFDPVLEALRLSRDDPSRTARIASASATAAQSPLQIARAAAELAELATEVASTGNPNLIGDARAGALLAEAVCQAAVELARINLAGQAGDPRLMEGEALRSRAGVARGQTMD
jgi:methenyltetrahydrofolate cyclohydrolase